MREIIRQVDLDSMNSMKAAVSNNRAVVIPRLHQEDVPVAIQAAAETNTQYRIITDADQARSLMYRELSRTSDDNRENEVNPVYLNYLEQVKGRIEAGGAALVLSYIDDKGVLELSSFWRRLRGLEADHARYLESLED